MMLGTKKLYMIMGGTIVAGLVVCAYLFVASLHSMNYGKLVPTDTSFATLPTQSSNINVNVEIKNLPLQVSLSQTGQLKKYIASRTSSQPTSSPVVANLREGSVVYESGGITFLVDVPVIQQTYAITTFDDGVSSIGCASENDQKEALWVCTDEGVDE